jgi:hydrogenase maturation protein HypF
MNCRRLQIAIQGAVQGVGFRPFVYRLATELGLAGQVRNDAQGVHIEVEGAAPLLEQFLVRLPQELPPLALIQALDHSWLAPLGYADFSIVPSADQGTPTTLLLPDVATCPDCLAEVGDPQNRRYRYAFTNCTNCGPRFTIIAALPYDRPFTTMRGFPLCPACRREYADPGDRRFHAQPNACPVCGPQPAFATLAETDDAGSEVPGLAIISRGDAALAASLAALRAGRIVAVKGIGGFHLMVDPANAEAVSRLRRRKCREEKPFALMCRDLAQARLLCAIAPPAADLLSSPAAPIVLLPRLANAPVAAAVAPGNPYLGLMLPAMPLQHLLLQALPGPLLATSGNRSDEPICTDEAEAAGRLGKIADAFLIHNRPIARHVDDSVATLFCGMPRLLRRARGYAPLPVLLAAPAATVLALGAHLKNTVALSVGRQVFVSQHIGDLATAEALQAFEHVCADLLRLYAVQPAIIAHDLHPDYASTHYAHRLLTELAADGKAPPARFAVQHHHAHLAACLVENQAAGPALGVIWDGTGYGLDGSIWGGEFLLGDQAGSQRLAHLRRFRLPGGAAAVREPRRVALALLWELYGSAALERDDLPAIRSFSEQERRLLGRMLARGLNSPLSSSAGRLFDGVAALIGLRDTVSYEGQAALQLEWIADPATCGSYPFVLQPQPNGPLLLDWQPCLESLLTDLARGTSPATMAARFHHGLVQLIATVARHVAIDRVALSGGCFQNRLLVEGSARQLQAAGYNVLLHRRLPPGDACISLGQVAAATAANQSF